MAKGKRVYSDPDAQSLFEVGYEFFQDAEALTERADGVFTNTAAFLTGWGLELVLKSYIVHVGILGVADSQLHIHNLRTLWEWAASGPSSPFTLPPPSWLDLINNSHDTPNFLYRYRPADLGAFAVPGAVHREEMAKLIEQAANELNALPDA